MSEIQKIIDEMDPEEALAQLSEIIPKLFLVSGDEARNGFIANVFGESGDDRIGSLVHL